MPVDFLQQVLCEYFLSSLNAIFNSVNKQHLKKNSCVCEPNTQLRRRQRYQPTYPVFYGRKERDLSWIRFFSWNANAKSLLTDLSWLHIGSENNSSYYLQVNDFSSRSIENYPNPAILPNIVY